MLNLEKTFKTTKREFGFVFASYSDIFLVSFPNSGSLLGVFPLRVMWKFRIMSRYGLRSKLDITKDENLRIIFKTSIYSGESFTSAKGGVNLFFPYCFHKIVSRILIYLLLINETI